MEILWVLVAAVVVLGPWVLAAVAFARASRAVREAAEAKASAAAAWRAARPAPEPGVAAEEPLDTVLVPSPSAAPPVEPRGGAPLPAVPSPPAPAGAGRGDALEEKIALVWFTRAGALAVLVGVGYFLKYAIDNAWLGPWGRISLASAAGAGALVAGEALRARTRPIWIHGLQGAGLALLFLAGFGSHALYRLVPVGVAFAAVAAVALLGGALAVRHRAEILLGLALVGGLLAPVLLSTGEDRPLALFGYLLVLTGLTLLVSARLAFRIVPWIALSGAAVLGAGWYDRFFDVAPPPRVPDPMLPVHAQSGRYFPLAARAVPLAAAVLLSGSLLAAHQRFRREAPRLWADAWLAAALLFSQVTLFAVLFDRPPLVGAALAGTAALSAALLARTDRLELLLGSEVVALCLLALAVLERRTGSDGAWLAAVALVAAVHVGAVARSWLVRRVAPGVWLAAVAAVAGLGFAAAAIELTAEGVGRAALVGAAGAVELALGAAVVRVARRHASVLLGAALALLAGAAAFLFSGATVTVVWAALAATAAVLGARERDRWWLAGAAAMFGAALFRVAEIDLVTVEAASRRFLWSAGAEGRLEPVFLLNARAISLAGAGAALLVAAAAIRRAPVFGEAVWRVVAGLFASAAWALLVALAVTEARDLVLTLPHAPPPGDTGAFAAFRGAVADARLEQRGALSVTTSVVLAGCASLLVGGGFLFRDAFHRWLGLALFGVVLGKLVLSDVWRLSRLEQVAVFLSVGVLLLAAAFLYARHGKRIAALLRDEPRRHSGTLLVLLAAGSLTAPARALDPQPFRFVREIEGVTSAGLYSVEVDRDLFTSSRAAPGTLADVRIEGPGGTEVPWVLRSPARTVPERTVEGAVVDPVVLPDGSVRALVDLGPAPPRHGELRLDLSGEEYLRPVRIESSGDGREFGLLAEGGRVWAIREAAGAGASRTWVRHPPSEARFVRVTLLPGAGQPPRILGARVAAGEAADPPLRLGETRIPKETRSADARETLLDVDLGAPGLPVEAVLIEVATGAFERRVRVFSSADGAHWVASGGGAVWRALPGREGRTQSEGLRVAARTEGRRWIRLAILDGDSPPLRVTAVRVGWSPRELVFRAEEAGRHQLLSGADVAAPAYDLGGLLSRGGERATALARIGERRENPRHREVEPVRPFTERHRTALMGALAALFAALAIWAVKLLRRSDAGGAS